MSKQQTNTKKGAAAIYIVIFTATLLGVVTLSFVRLMLAESMRTTNYSLSQSAYNSALAGIEDAKVVLLRYQSCVDSGSTLTSGVECTAYINAFNAANAANSAEDCDLVRDLLGYDTTYNKENHETLIQTNTSNTVSSSGAAFDQAYTCVKINQKSSDYLTTMTENYPSKIIPIRTTNKTDPNNPEHVNQVNRIVISWFSNKNINRVTLDGALDTTNYTAAATRSAATTGSNFNSFLNVSTNANPYYNSFGSPNKPTAPPALQMTLIQTAEAFKLSQFYTNDGSKTNRGTLTLRPIMKDSKTLPAGKTFTTHIANTSAGINAIAASANKSQNAPIDVQCDIYNPELDYACTADIAIPRPVNGPDYTITEKYKKITAKILSSTPYSYYKRVERRVCSRYENGSCKSWSSWAYYHTISPYSNLPSNTSTTQYRINGNGGVYEYSYRYQTCLSNASDGSCVSWSSVTTRISGDPPSTYTWVTREIVITSANNNKRNSDTAFLVLTSPYGAPEAEVSVKLMHCENDSTSISNCDTINFANVQPIVDSTGRANDLFRRVEARIELVDAYFPIANFALAADDDATDNDNIKKDFYVTSGCSYKESYSNGTEIVYADTSCKNAGDRSSSIAPSMNP